MIIDRFQQQPREVRAKQIDYSAFLVDDTLDDLIAVVTEVQLICGDADDSLTPFELTNVAITSPTMLGYHASGGASGNQYQATFIVTTTGGQVHEAEIIFTIKEI